MTATRLFHDRAMQGFHLHAAVVRQRQGTNLSRQVRFSLVDAHHDHALETLHENLHAVFRSADLLDDAARADGVEVVRSGLFHGGIALREQHDRFILARQRRLDCGHRRGPPGRQRHEQVRKKNGILKRQHGKGLQSVC